MDFSSSHSRQRTCLNGHVVSNEADDEEAQLWCHLCGRATIDQCPACKGPLRGRAIHGAYVAKPKPDSYCLHCGKALPWTETHIIAVREIARFIDTFSEEDRSMLEQILPDLVSSESTPRTQVGIVKMKMLLKKGGADFWEGTRKILVDVVSETVQKALFPK
jgi:hypothetical protein